ncbi:MAG TPA: FGGY family carbohydrate kinase [Spirochaetia bacterium]
MYLTFDIGTTSVKIVLYAPDGRPAAKAIRNYALDTPGVNWYEAAPDLYWDAVVSGTREVLAASKVDPREIRTVSGCSQGETVVFLDADGRPVRPAIVWLDLRARAEADELSALATADELYAVTGQSGMDPTWSATKVLWVKRHEPAVFARTALILLVEDYITWRLTGRACTTANLLSSTLFVDVHRHAYWERFVEPLGVARVLPEIVEPGDAVGTVSHAVARELGLAPGTLVVKGAMDQVMSAIGAGNYRPGIITETTGSVMAIGVTARSVDASPIVRLPYQPHVVPESFLFLPYVQTAGSAYKWWRDRFCQEEVREAGDLEAAYERMNALAASVPAGGEGVVFLPFLAGAGQPENNPDARAVFYGLTLKHGKGHCARAIMESIAFMLRKILADFAKSGVPMTEIRSMGGGARSDLWLQIKADATGIPLVRMEEEETSTLGAAILAAVRVGDRPGIAEAVAAMVRFGRRFEPDPRARAAYEKSFALYNDLYDALVPVFGRFSR